MNENTDKYFENIANKVIKQSTIESPSFNFTDTVMSQILELNNSLATVYKPLISKNIWLLIFVVLTITIFYITYFGGQFGEGNWLSQVDFGMFSNNKISNLLSFNVSKTVTYAVVFLAIMVGVQVVYLKHHFNQFYQN